MKQCTKCGAQIDKDDVFCRSCGQKADNSTQKNLSYKKTAISIGAIVGIFAIGVLLTNPLNKKDSSTDNSESVYTAASSATAFETDYSEETTDVSTEMMNTEMISETDASDIESSSNEAENYEIPYVPGDFSKIGEKFSTFHVDVGGLQYSPQSMAILCYNEYPLNNDYWCDGAYGDKNGYYSRIGVIDDTIIFNIVDASMFESEAKISELVPLDMQEVKPLIIYGYDNNYNVTQQALLWKGDNGYKIYYATASKYPEESYLDETFLYSISTVDLKYLYGIPEEVIISNEISTIPQKENDNNDANKDLTIFINGNTNDVFEKYGYDYKMIEGNGGGLIFDEEPNLTFWVECDWNTGEIINEGEVYSVQAGNGGSLNYGIVVGKTNISEIEALTNGKYNEKDLYFDENVSGRWSMIIKQNDCNTYYDFDDSGTVIFGLLKKN